MKIINSVNILCFQINESQWLESKNLKIPLLEHPPGTKGVFKFCPPSDVKLIGSLNLECAVKPDVSADLVMLLPKVDLT